MSVLFKINVNRHSLLLGNILFYYVITTFLHGTALINNVDYLGNSSKRNVPYTDKVFNFWYPCLLWKVHCNVTQSKRLQLLNLNKMRFTGETAGFQSTSLQLIKHRSLRNSTLSFYSCMTQPKCSI